MCRSNYDAAIEYAVNRLRRELPPRLTYHDVWHTQHDVLPAVARLGIINSLPHDQIRLLEVAAAFHDIGFVETCEGHEEAGVRIVTATLPDLCFNDDQIETIVSLIRVTRLPQSPRNLLEQIMADADLDVLGRDDFFDRNELLRQEAALMGRAISWRGWQSEQLEFLEQHTYHTPVARALRDPGKQRHIKLIKDWLRRGHTPDGSM